MLFIVIHRVASWSIFSLNLIGVYVLYGAVREEPLAIGRRRSFVVIDRRRGFVAIGRRRSFIAIGRRRSFVVIGRHLVDLQPVVVLLDEKEGGQGDQHASRQHVVQPGWQKIKAQSREIMLIETFYKIFAKILWKESLHVKEKASWKAYTVCGTYYEKVQKEILFSHKARDSEG